MATLLSVNNYYYRRDGSEVVYFEHNRAFERQGWQVVPFAMHHASNEASKFSATFVEEIEFGASYSLVEKLRRAPKIIYSLEAQRNLEALLTEVEPSIAHCHTIYHHLSPSILPVLARHNIPTVMTIHDLKLACPAYHMHTGNKICEDCVGGSLRKVVQNRCIKNSVAYSSLIYLEARFQQFLGTYSSNVDRFVSPCQFYIDKLVESGWDRNRFVHIPNSLTPAEFEPDFSGGEGYILYFGRLSVEKGLVTLLQAAASAGVPIALAGDGPQADELHQIADELDVDVRFLGRLAPEQLADAVRSASATVLPAEWYENAPMSILESFAWGKPVIASRIGGIPEMVESGSNGVLVEPGSVADLAAAMSGLLGSTKARLAEMGSAARQTLETRFSTALYTERMQNLYGDLGVEAELPNLSVAAR